MIFDREHDQKLKPTLYPAVMKADTPGDVIVDTLGFKAVVGYIYAGTIPQDAGATYQFIVEVGNDPDFGAPGEPYLAIPVVDFSDPTKKPLLLTDEILPDGAPSDQAPGTVAALSTDTLKFGLADSNKVFRFGYVGPYRYIRVSLKGVTGAPGTGALFGAFIELTEADRKPVVQD